MTPSHPVFLDRYSRSLSSADLIVSFAHRFGLSAEQCGALIAEWLKAD